MKLRKVAKNAGASFITQIVNIITNFILPPLLIATYGSQINGLVTTIKQLMSYIKLVGAGISVATTHSLYKPIAKQDHKKTSGILNASNSMFTKAGILFSLIALIVSFIYPLFLSESLDYYLIVMLIIVMSIEGASEFFVVGKYRSLLYADQKSYITSIVQSIGIVLSFIFAYALIKNNVNIVLVQLASSLVFIVRILLLSAYVNRNYKFLDSKTPPIQTANEKRNDAFIHQLSGLVILSSQVIVLSTFAGLDVASIYAVYNVVFSGLFSICSQTMSSVAPFLGRTIALNNINKLKNEFNKVEFIYNMVLSYIYSLCTILIIPFISVYVGGVSDINYVDYGVASLFVMISYFNNVRLPAQSLINVAGHFKETRSRAIIEAIVCIALQLILVNSLGIYGVLIGTAVTLGWRCFDIIFYSNKYIIKQRNLTSIFRAIKIPCIAIVVLIINIEFVQFNVSGYMEWVNWAIIYSFISIAIILIINLVFERRLLIDIYKLIFRLISKKI